MAEGAVPAPADAQFKIGTWLRRQSSALLVFGAIILGLLLSPVFSGLDQLNVTINDRISVVTVVWLIVALVLCAVIIRARAGISRALGEATRQWLTSQPLASAAPGLSRDEAADTPALGAALVRGILNLAVLLVVQSILREPVVELASDYSTRALVDGAWVVLVFLVALVMLFGLHRVGKPLAAHVVWLGLDQLVPTAGFAGRQLPTTSSPSKASPAPSAPPSQRRADAASAAPAEATRLAPADGMASGSEATVLAPAAACAPSDDLATIAEPAAEVAGATILAPAPVTAALDEATEVEPAPSAPQPPQVSMSSSPVAPSTDQTLSGAAPSTVSAPNAEPNGDFEAGDGDVEGTLVVDASAGAEKTSTPAEGQRPSGDTPQPDSSTDKTFVQESDSNPPGGR